MGGHAERGQGDDLAEARHGGRRAMVADLLRDSEFRRANRASVIKLLGPPDESARNGDVTYWLGPEKGGMGLRSEWLVIRFTSTGRVAAARIVRDARD